MFVPWDAYNTVWVCLGLIVVVVRINQRIQNNIRKKYEFLQEKEKYILEVIKSDFSEPGDEDIIKKLYKDLKDKNISENNVREKLDELLQIAKKDFL